MTIDRMSRRYLSHAPGNSVTLIACAALLFCLGCAAPRSSKAVATPSRVTSSQSTTAHADAMDGFYLNRCPLCGTLLGAKGEAIEVAYDARQLRFCCRSCSERFSAHPGALIVVIDDVLISDQRPFYPTVRSLIDGRPLGPDPIAFIWGNRLFLAADDRDQAAILANPGAAVRTLDRLVVERQRPSYGMPDKCPVQGDILPNEARIDIVVANRMVRVCCGRCAAVVRARPYQYLAMVEYANREAMHLRSSEASQGDCP
jgi:hypothetical protein